MCAIILKIRNFWKMPCTYSEERRTCQGNKNKGGQLSK